MKREGEKLLMSLLQLPGMRNDDLVKDPRIKVWEATQNYLLFFLERGEATDSDVVVCGCHEFDPLRMFFEPAKSSGFMGSGCAKSSNTLNEDNTFQPSATCYCFVKLSASRLGGRRASFD